MVVLVHELQHHSFTANEWLLLLAATGVFAVRLLSFWGIVGRISYRLAHTVHWASMPLIDLMLAVYYGFSGV